jgi:hypothetical protein
MLISGLITSFVTIIGVVLANQLTYGRTNRQKLWELRRQTYGLMLSELARVERLLDSADMSIQEDATRYFEGESYSDDNRKISSHMATAWQRFTADYLVLSDGFIDLYEKFGEAITGDPYNYLPPEEHERFATILRQWRPRLMKQARSEMPLSRAWRLSLIGGRD